MWQCPVTNNQTKCEQIGHIVTVTLKTLAYSGGGGGGGGGDFPRKATNLLYGCLITRSELYIFF